MTSVVGTAILNLIQEKIIVRHITGHIAVLPGFVKLDAVFKMVKAQVIATPEGKQVVARHQKRAAKPAGFQNGLPHHDGGVADARLADGLENPINKFGIYGAASIKFIRDHIDAVGHLAIQRVNPRRWLVHQAQGAKQGQHEQPAHPDKENMVSGHHPLH